MSNRQNNPFVAALIGLLLVPGSMALQAWNEYRTIHRTRGLNEAEQIVETIVIEQSVHDDLEGTLVHLAGEAETEEKLRDPRFGVESQAIRLSRVVEMFQWEEEEDNDDDYTTYYYRTGWHEGRIDSDRFDQQHGHQNPQPTFNNWDKLADTVMIGEYKLSDALKRQKSDGVNASFEIDQVREAVGEQHAKRITVDGPHLYYSVNDVAAISAPELATKDRSPRKPGSPQIGDLRIRFEMVPQGPVSLMAGLKKNSFAPYRTSNGEPIERLYSGLLTSDQVVANMRFENSTLAWMLRGAGFVLCLIGITMIFAPAQSLFQWVPLVGDIAGGMIFVVALAGAAFLSLTTIAISWVAVRPVMTIGMLLIAGGILYFLRRTRKRVDGAESHFHQDDAILLSEDAIVE